MGLPALVSVKLMDSPKQTVVGDAEKDAVGPNTKEAQSSLKLVWASIAVQFAVDQSALSTEIQTKLEFPVA